MADIMVETEPIRSRLMCCHVVQVVVAFIYISGAAYGTYLPRLLPQPAIRMDAALFSEHLICTNAGLRVLGLR